MDQKAAADRFRDQHKTGQILVLPNAWDVGSAKLFEAVGFDFIATTSSGIEFAQCLSADLEARKNEMISFVARIIEKVRAPVSVDIEGGFATDSDTVRSTVEDVIRAGAIGINLEDTIDGFEVAKRTGKKLQLIPFEESVSRIGKARQAADSLGVPLVVNARTDAFTLGMPLEDALKEAIKRGNAYLDTGADCVFVPYASNRETIGKLAKGIRGPVNILGGPQTPPICELEALGVSRVSIGGSMCRGAMSWVKSAINELKDEGTYSYAKDAISYEESIELLLTTEADNAGTHHE